MDFPTNEIRLLYNTFRNKLRALSLEDVLTVVWAYMGFLQFNNKIPDEIEVDASFLKHSTPSIVISEWELMLVVQEAILHSNHYPKPRKTIKRWSVLASLINSLKALINEVSGEFINTSNVMSEVFRIGHLQFPYSSKPNQIKAARYLKIFSSKPLEDILISKLGFDFKRLYALGYLFFGASLKHPAIRLPIDVSSIGITDAEVDQFLNIFSIGMDDLKKEVASNRALNELFQYRYNPLVASPLIRMSYKGEVGFVCPSTRMIFDKFTAGIYYDISSVTGFDQAWGEAFENYIGEVISVVNADQKWKVYDDFDDRTSSTADWLLIDDHSIVFIECKTKRLTLKSKTTLGQNSALEDDKGKLIRAIVQAYSALKRYLANDYPRFNHDPKLAPFVIVTMLEEWYGFLIKDPNFENHIREELAEKGISPDFIEKYPYFICSTEELERLLQVAKTCSFGEIFLNKTSTADHATWSIGTYLDKQYASTVENLGLLFPDFLNEVVALVRNPNSLK